MSTLLVFCKYSKKNDFGHKKWESIIAMLSQSYLFFSGDYCL